MKIVALILVSFLLTRPLFAQIASKTDNTLLVDYYQNQRFEDALNYLKKTYPEPITDVKVLWGFAYASSMAGKLPEAEDYYLRIYAADTSNTAVLFNLGNVNARRGNNMKALTYYKKILLRDSTNFSVFKQMATLSRNMGNITGAANYWQKANKLNPVEPDVAYDLTSFYINLKLYKSADTIVTTALQADTANLLLLFGKAQIDYRLDKYPETVDACTKLIRAGDQAGVTISMLGTAYFHLKKYDSCINTFKLLEQSNTASETSYYYTAMSYKALNKQVVATIYFDKAIKAATSENVNSYYSEMADSYDQLRQLKNAVNAYQKSLLYGPMPLTYYAIANLYDTGLKNKVKARQYYRKYLQSAPPPKQKSYVEYSKRRMNELSR